MERNSKPFALVDHLKICMISSVPITRLNSEKGTDTIQKVHTQFHLHFFDVEQDRNHEEFQSNPQPT